MEIIFAVVFGVILVIYVAAGLAFLVGLCLPAVGGRPESMTVSVIVAARNEASNIAECLECLLRQNLATHEIVVADDQSEDRTAEIVQDFARRDPRVRYVFVRETPPGVSPKKHALSQAIAASTGELLLFTDADCRVPPGWVESMTRCFSPWVGAVIGFSAIRSSGWVQGLQALDFMVLMTAARGASNVGLQWAASGQNLAYRREAYEAVGGFDSVKHRVSGDDVLMIGLIRKKTQWKVRFAEDPESYVETVPESTLTAYLNQRTRWASNGRYQSRLNPLFFFYLLDILLLNVMLLAGASAAFFWPAAGIVTLFALVVKLVVDFAVVSTGCSIFGKKALLRYFPMWFFLQPVYILYIALRANLGSFVWKGRRSRAMA